MKIGELARRSGLSVHTIRYYERIGLLPYVGRDRSSHRDYDESILTWIAFLGRLKTTDMPIREMLRYATLRAGGAATEVERQDLLMAHRERVRVHLAELTAALHALDAKIDGYAETMKRTRDHDASNREPARARKARAG